MQKKIAIDTESAIAGERVQERLPVGENNRAPEP